MDSIIGQAIIAELAAEYNSTIAYIEVIPSPLDEIHAFRHISADRNNALGPARSTTTRNADRSETDER